MLVFNEDNYKILFKGIIKYLNKQRDMLGFQIRRFIKVNLIKVFIRFWGI